ncbi:unnamed protein product [Adineta steineri]|uniref:Uncharacterized protein n=1 Tax=Adineta steineri TaxID=433720 RepID=A0A814WFZ4_9BILA|nr:unnamed protein product [Adineta steineri]
MFHQPYYSSQQSHPSQQTHPQQTHSQQSRPQQPHPQPQQQTHGQQHQPYYPSNRGSSNFFMPNHPFYYRPNAPPPNQSTHNLNFTHDFEHNQPHHGFTSMPSGSYPSYDYTTQNVEQQRWRHNVSRAQQQQHQQHQTHQQQQQQQRRQTPAFHFQDKSTSYFMTDPIVTNDDRLTIQLTKVHIGPNGDQQRVFVEQEFSNETELNKFVRNLRQNFEKTFNNRSSGDSSNITESNSTDSKKSGVVVVEEPDEEPKVYQQQAYNANIESKKAASSIVSPITSPELDCPSPEKFEERSRPPSFEHHLHHHHRYVSPPPSHISSVSTSRSNRRHRNKMKYRRQPTEPREEPKPTRLFDMPSFTRHYPPTTTPPLSRFQHRFSTEHDLRIKNEFNLLPPPSSNPNVQWRQNHGGYPKHRSRSYVPPMNDNYPPTSSTPSRFQNTTDPFFRPINPAKFPQQRQKDLRPPPPSSPSKFRRSQRRKPIQPTTISENHIYPNNVQQQQPRVHRTKSECRNFQNQQQHRSRSTTNQFQFFSPLQPPPIVQRHFVAFRSPPVFLSSIHSAAPMFYPNHRRQFDSMQPQLRLINHFRLGTNRF